MPINRLAGSGLVLFSILLLGGCRTLSAPAGGLATVTVTEGGFVETIAFAEGPTLNLQINEEAPPIGEPFSHQVLTVGNFSPVIGSGFTPSSDIYYQERIGSSGWDTFQVEGRYYRVRWDEVGYVPGDGYPGRVFSVTIEQR